MSHSARRSSSTRRALVAVAVVFLPGCGGTVSTHDANRGDGGPSGGVFAGAAGGPGASGASGGRRGGTGGKAGSAASTGSSSGCGTGQALCTLGCADLMSDPNNCGFCGNGCSGQCVNGSCQKAPPTPCGAGLTFCTEFGKCLDLLTNSWACGSCTGGCANAEACVNGQCVQGECIPGMVWCTSADGTGQCVLLDTDTKHCGACGTQCGVSETCQKGQCVPPDCSGLTYCKGVGCMDVQNDIAACGACGGSCTGASLFDYSAYVCNGGKCSCSASGHPCGKGCASSFWYCPPDGFTGSLPDYCRKAARDTHEACACGACLAEVQACFASSSCINSMDCSLSGSCQGCPFFLGVCTDTTNATDPLAQKLVDCMTRQCASP